MAEISEREELICKKLTELSEIYKSVKHIFLLVEYYNGKKGIVVSSINELRSAFDHVMRAMTKEDLAGLEDEIDSSKKHLFRAAYDACEVIILDRLDYIESLKRMVSFKSIAEIYPEYVSEILPFAAQLKKEIVDVRQIDDLKERVKEYEDKITKIIDYSEKLELYMPAADKLKEEEDVRSLFSPTVVTSIAGSVLAVVALLVVLFPDIPVYWQAIVGFTFAVLSFSIIIGRKRGGNV